MLAPALGLFGLRAALFRPERDRAIAARFYDKFYVSRGRLCRSARAVCLTVTPTFGADCAESSHARHESYARAQVVAFWRMIPTEQRRDALFDFLAVPPAQRGAVDTRTWGGTLLAWRVDRALGVADLVLNFDGGRDRRGRETGWAMALLEMLVDPYLVAFVPGWVVEQYERANRFFRGSLRKILRKLPTTATNKEVLRRTKCLMETRQERATARSSAEMAAAGDPRGLDAGSESEGSSGAGEDPELDVPVDPTDAEAEAAPAVAILREPLPSAGDVGAEQGAAAGDDWARAGPAELLSAAGAAAAVADIVAGGAPASAGGARCSADGARVNPPGHTWLSAVPRQEHDRIKRLWDLWKGTKVPDGKAPDSDTLDQWQRFALDIAFKKAQERSAHMRTHGDLHAYRPLRMMCSGSAGTGKSSTIRVIVHAWREAVSASQALSSAAVGAPAAGEPTILAAPTGCASFQIKHGATTAHRLFGVPIGYCGPLKEGGEPRRRLHRRLSKASLAVLDEFSMLGRQFMGKILYRVGQVLGGTPRRFGGGRAVSMGGLDVILAGHSAQNKPVGDEPLFKMGPYCGKGLNKPSKGERPADAPTCSALVDRACLFRDEILQDPDGDVVILRQVHRVDETGSAELSESARRLFSDEAERFLEATGRLADLTWTQQDHAWLARRNRSALQATEGGRAELRAFDHAVVLMCRRRRGIRGEDGAEQYNAAELRRLAARTGRPILAIGAHHNRPEQATELRPEYLDSEEFRGLEARLELCEGARVLLTNNEWPEA